jgi:hypothetical protein
MPTARRVLAQLGEVYFEYEKNGNESSEPSNCPGEQESGNEIRTNESSKYAVSSVIDRIKACLPRKINRARMEMMVLSRAS